MSRVETEKLMQKQGKKRKPQDNHMGSLLIGRAITRCREAICRTVIFFLLFWRQPIGTNWQTICFLGENDVVVVEEEVGCSKANFKKINQSRSAFAVDLCLRYGMG
jgi:hypothetical protein